MRCENNFNNLQASKCSFLRSTLLALMLSFSNASYGEVILQYFGTSWSEITTRIPELAEAGWSALWLPPPFKAGSIFSVGFDTYDRFDFGSKDQMGEFLRVTEHLMNSLS